MSLDVKALKKSEVDGRELAALAWAAGKARAPAQDVPQGETVREIAQRIANDCYEWILAACDGDRLVGWLAFYAMSDPNIAQIWDWHPVVRPGEQESDVARALIQAAFSHLRESGLRQVTVDFRVDQRTQARLASYLDWYAQCGLSGVIEEERYQVDLEGIPQAVFPDGYSLGYISETDLDTLFDCWLEVFSSSSDQFMLGLDARGRREFFLESWRKGKPLIDEASLTLSHRGRLMGLCRVLPLYELTDGCLAPIGIVPEYRGRGLAQALLRASMSRLKALNYQTISCFVSTNNQAAISLYRRLGFSSRYRIASLFGEIED